jgi:tetratricopeptide (TPR) repeat protein
MSDSRIRTKAGALDPGVDRRRSLGWFALWAGLATTLVLLAGGCASTSLPSSPPVENVATSGSVAPQPPVPVQTTSEPAKPVDLLVSRTVYDKLIAKGVVVDLGFDAQLKVVPVFSFVKRAKAPAVPKAHASESESSLVSASDEEEETESHEDMEDLPQVPMSLAERGMDAFREKKYDEAKELFKEALEQVPESPFLNLQLAKIYLAMKETEVAEGILSDFLEEHRSPEAILMLAEVFVQTKRSREARPLLVELIALRADRGEFGPRLSKMVQRVGLRMLDERLYGAVQVNLSDGRLNVRFRDEESLKTWGETAVCIGAWQVKYERSNVAESRREDEAETMYIQCLKNQASALSVRMKRGEAVSARGRWLYEVVLDGFLSTMVRWEVTARNDNSMGDRFQGKEWSSLRNYVATRVVQDH